jgi:hypothetical protein
MKQIDIHLPATFGSNWHEKYHFSVFCQNTYCRATTDYSHGNTISLIDRYNLNLAGPTLIVVIDNGGMIYSCTNGSLRSPPPSASACIVTMLPSTTNFTNRPLFGVRLHLDSLFVADISSAERG